MCEKPPNQQSVDKNFKSSPVPLENVKPGYTCFLRHICLYLLGSYKHTVEQDLLIINTNVLLGHL